MNPLSSSFFAIFTAFSAAIAKQPPHRFKRCKMGLASSTGPRTTIRGSWQASGMLFCRMPTSANFCHGPIGRVFVVRKKVHSNTGQQPEMDHWGLDDHAECILQRLDRPIFQARSAGIRSGWQGRLKLNFNSTNTRWKNSRLFLLDREGPSQARIISYKFLSCKFEQRNSVHVLFPQ